MTKYDEVIRLLVDGGIDEFKKGLGQAPSYAQISPGEEPAILWQLYIQITEIEAVFRNLKGDLAIRPIHNQKDSRIEVVKSRASS